MEVELGIVTGVVPYRHREGNNRPVWSARSRPRSDGSGPAAAARPTCSRRSPPARSAKPATHTGRQRRRDRCDVGEGISALPPAVTGSSSQRPRQPPL